MALDSIIWTEISAITLPHKFNIKLEMDGQYYNLWSTDNERTDANDDVVIKSVYDPSPVGYSLPASNAFTGFTITGQNAGTWNTPGNPDHFNVKFPFEKGWYFYTKLGKAGLNTFIPASGVRQYSNGNIRYLSPINGFEWNADIIGEKRGRTLYFLNNRIDTISDDWKSWGHPVRSAEERKLISSISSGRWTDSIIICGVRIMIRLMLMMRW